MDDDKIELKMPKLSNLNIIIIAGALLLVIFVYSLSLTYELGFYNGGSEICNPLSLGIHDDGYYLCFNESLQQVSPFTAMYSNVSMEGLNWS